MNKEDHDCEHEGVWDFCKTQIDYGNKPKTATVPGECEVCGRDLLLTIEITGVVDGESKEPIYHEH